MKSSFLCHRLPVRATHTGLLLLTLGALSACQSHQTASVQSLQPHQPSGLSAEITSITMDGVKTENLGQMQLNIDWPGLPQADFGLQAIPSSTTSLKITITGPGQPDLVQTVQRPNGVYASSYRLVFMSLVAGSGRRISVEAIDSSSKIVARGEATNVNILAQQFNRQRITLTPVSVPLPTSTPYPGSGGGGGGGGGAPAPVTPVNQAPVVTGINHSFAFNQTATSYEGQVSAIANDPEGQPLTYTWSASAGTFANNGSANANWSGPAGTHDFTVIVSDGVNSTSFTRQLTLGPNQPPVIGSIVPSMNFQGPGHQGSLAATGVSDPENQPLTYLWKIPANAGTLTQANQAVAQWSGAPSGQHLVTLDVSDGIHTTTRTLLVNLANQSPLIQDIDVSGLSEISSGVHAGNLNVMASDPENQPLSYLWSLSRGSLTTADTSNPVGWNSGAQANISEQYTATVTVSDGQASQTFSKNFTLRNNQAPVITGLQQNITETTPGNFNGSLAVSATDPENNALTYTWVDSNPSILQSLSGATVQLKPNVPAGTYSIQVKAHDGRLDSASSTQNIVLSTNNLPPVIQHLSRHIPFNQGVHSGVLGVAATDPENRPLSYSWQIISQPGGASLTNANTDSPGFSGPQGNYTVRVTITDGTVAPTQTITGDLSFTLIDPNLAPSVTGVSAGQSSYNSQTSLHTVQLTAAGTDPESQPLSYSWSSSGGTLSAGTGNPISFTAPAGTYQLSVRANDGTNLSPVYTYPVTFTNPNRPPVISGVTPTLSLNNGQYTGQLAVTASDPDNNPLTYTWSVVSGGSSLAASTGQSVGWTAAAGAHQIQVVAHDGQTSSAPFVFNTTLQNNQAPQISGIDVSSDAINFGGSQFQRNLTVNATDPDSANLTYNWSVLSGSPAGSFLQASTFGNTADTTSRTVAYRANPNTVYVVRVQVSDGVNTSTYSKSVLLNNNPPIVTSLNYSVACAGNGTYTVPLNASIIDFDGHPITSVDWSVSGGSLSGSSQTQRNWTLPSVGTYRLTIKPSDAYSTSTTTLDLTVSSIGSPCN